MNLEIIIRLLYVGLFWYAFLNFLIAFLMKNGTKKHVSEDILNENFIILFLKLLFVYERWGKKKWKPIKK